MAIAQFDTRASTVVNEFKDPKGYFDKSANQASAGLGDVHDDWNVLPRTNMAKRLRSITFMLVKLKSDSKGKVVQPETEVGIHGIHTLLVGPQSYQQSEPNRSTVVQTLGGAFIDDWGLGLKQITISGTTGKATRLVGDNFPVINASGGQTGASVSGVMAKDGYTAFKEFRDKIYRRYFDTSYATNDNSDLSDVMDRNRGLAIGSNNRAVLTGVRGEGISTPRAANLNREIPDGKTAGGEGRPNIRLKMYYWGNEDYYMVHPLSFSFTQSAEEPTIYRYHLELIVIKDLSAAEATADLQRAAFQDPFTNLTDARYRSVQANKQIAGGILFDIVKKNYDKYGQLRVSSLAHPASLGWGIAPVQKTMTKNPPTLVGMFNDVSTQNLINKNDSFGSPENVSDIGYRDQRGKFQTKYTNSKSASQRIISGDHRHIVINASRYDAYDVGLQPTDSELGDYYNIIDLRKGNMPKGFGEVARGWVLEDVVIHAPISGNVVKFLQKETFGDRVQKTINGVNDLRKDLDNKVNGRTTFLKDIQEWQKQLNQINELERSVLSLPRALIPYDLVNNMRQLYCDIAALIKFPELFKDAIETALEDFRNLLKNSGCAQTL